MCERAGRIELQKRAAGDDLHPIDNLALGYADNSLARAREQFLVIYLEIITLLSVSIEALPRKAGLRLGETRRYGIAEPLADGCFNYL